ncbi:MAG: methyltransferase domain-containing protein [Lentisphaerae bacterium]|nr:methyltransferase domain-containing protein [Lentisphaerota bacterium]
MHVEQNMLAVAARFSAAADTYHQAARVQEKVAATLSHLFPAQASLPTASSACILEIGCGTGLLTQFIRRHYPTARIDVVELSAPMIAQARARMHFDERIRWRVADLRQVPAGASYPLIVSSSSLHWIHPLAEGMNRMASLLAPGGYAVFSLMLRGTLGELRQCRLAVAPHKPPVGNLPTYAQVRRSLRQAGLTMVTERRDVCRAVYPSAEAFVRHIHAQGLTSGLVSISHQPLNRKELQALFDLYQTRHAVKDGVRASYRVAYCMARKEGG